MADLPLTSSSDRAPKGAPRRGDRDHVQFQLSPLLLIGIVAAVISTVAVVISAVSANHGGPGPVQGQQLPPPPPTPVALYISLALFVISWVTVAVAVARDQVVMRIASAAAHRDAHLDDLRAILDADHHELRAQLGPVLLEYGELKHTEGYFTAIRHTAHTPGPNGDIPRLRPVPPPERFPSSER